MKYTIKRTNVAPAMDFAWDGACWKDAETAELTNLRPEGSGHRPVVKVRVLHDDRNLYGIYQVQDRYVLAEKEGFQARQPRGERRERRERGDRKERS